jgi:hypothetical protein
VYLLRKRTVEVCSSNLTIGPQEPRRPRFPFFHLHNVKERTLGASFEGSVMEAVLPNFWEQNFASGSPAAYLPYQKSLPPGRKAVCISEAGYMADGFCCQHPKMTKPTKNETPISPSKIPSRAGTFSPSRPEPCMWEVGESSARRRRGIPRPLP